jgi:diguanylate cyclase (GGDEF)-like protein/PAS domain S-box-containing protein
MLSNGNRLKKPSNHLIWGIWLGVGLFFIYITSSTLNSYRETLSRARNDALDQARLVAEHATTTIEFADLALLTAKDLLRDEDMVASVQLASSRREFLNSTLKIIQSRVRGVVSISVTDADGVVFANSLGIAPGISLASRDYFKVVKTQTQNAPVISEAILGRVSNKWGIQVARRLEFIDGRFAGMLVANLGLAESFDAFYESLTQGKRDAIALYDVDSRLISRYPRADQLIGKKLPRNSVSDAFKNLVPEGVIEQESVVDGQVRLFAFQRLPRYPLYSMVAPLKADAMSAWTRERNLDLLYVAMALLAGLYLTHLTRKGERSLSELESVRNHLEEIANGGMVLIWTSGKDGLCDYFNLPWLQFTGRTLAQELGNGWTEGIHPDDYEQCLNTYTSNFDQRTSFTMEYRLRHACGQYRWILDQGNARFDKSGEFIGYIGFCYDITDRVKADQQIRQAASVFSYAREGILITDTNGVIIEVNEAFTRITGYTREEALGQHPRLLKSGRHDKAFYESMWSVLLTDGHWTGEIWNRRKDGELYVELTAISAIRDASGKTLRYVALFSDITLLKKHQSQLEHIAHFDALTNLPNRVLLADRLQHAMLQALRRRQLLAVIYLDLDGFKAINDGHGHDAGDQVLIALAQRMKQVLREGDTLARLGGDEFVAVLIDLEDVAACVPMINRLLTAAAQQVQLGDLTLQVSASVGVTFYPQDHTIDADQLLRQSDQAMYQAKVAGKNRYQIFDDAQDRDLRGYHESLERIRLALEQREFVLYYQPKVNMRSGKVIGSEALIRWKHPEKGLLPPGAFLPVIEDHKLAVEVGEWVIDAALTQIESWLTCGLDLGVSVNIGARQLQQSDFVDRLKTIIAKHPNVSSSKLELEVLETSALADMEQVSQVIENCHELGVRFALDDFGTGYSSLTYLKRLRVAMLKIDQSFVRDMLDDPDDLAILEGVIGLAAAFKREVIAEGVETVAHGTALLHLGCELAQGYGIARPMPPEQLPDWVASWQPDAAWCELPWLGGDFASTYD